MNFFVGIFQVDFDYKFQPATLRAATFKNSFFLDHLRWLLAKVLLAIYIFKSLLAVTVLCV